MLDSKFDCIFFFHAGLTHYQISSLVLILYSIALTAIVVIITVRFCRKKYKLCRQGEYKVYQMI